MKKWITVFALATLVSTASLAQEYKKFKVGIGLGYALPSKGSGGVLLYLEPMYRIQDNIAVGLRIESAAIIADIPSVSSASLSVSAVGSYTLNGQYYFGSGGSFRPFVGAGFGMFITQAASADPLGNVAFSPSATSIGFYPRIGFDLSHFNLSLDYNLIPEQTSQLGGSFTATTQNFSYIGIRLGFSIGGGKL